MKTERASRLNARSATLALGSVAVGIILILILIRMSHVDLRAVLLHLRTMNRAAFLRLSLLMAVNSALSSWKWRLVDRRLRAQDDSPIRPLTSFTVTSTGVALGQFLPVQMSVSAARTLVTWTSGRALRRGTLGTLFEQGFDFVVVCFLAIPSFLVFLVKGNFVLWLLLTLIACITSFASVGFLMSVLRKKRTDSLPNTRSRKFIAELRQAPLLDAGLGRRLMLISMCRFLVLVLMAGETTKAIHFSVPLWHLACAMPFVVVASSIGTPGGLGLNEFAYVTTLRALGLPLAFSTQWALANRVLTSSGAFLVCAFALLLQAFQRLGRGTKNSEDVPLTEANVRVFADGRSRLDG